MVARGAAAHTSITCFGPTKIGVASSMLGARSCHGSARYPVAIAHLGNSGTIPTAIPARWNAESKNSELRDQSGLAGLGSVIPKYAPPPYMPAMKFTSQPASLNACPIIPTKFADSTSELMYEILTHQGEPFRHSTRVDFCLSSRLRQANFASRSSASASRSLNLSLATPSRCEPRRAKTISPATPRATAAPGQLPIGRYPVAGRIYSAATPTTTATPKSRSIAFAIFAAVSMVSLVSLSRALARKRASLTTLAVIGGLGLWSAIAALLVLFATVPA
jgi:hypothetical protein